MIKRIGGLFAIALLVVQPLAAADRGDPEKAAEYYAKAMEFLDDRDRWYDAAVLLERAAREMDPAAQRASATMRFAGHVFAQAKRWSDAQEALEEAGDLALARGDLNDAAASLVQAAHVAAARGRADDVEALTERVRRFTASPLLSAGQKSRLLRLVAPA
jgi:tetratricopeptide (TPR) repeat protein